jgi:hypothetical protein
MSMEMGELAVKVDGKLVYSYKQSGERKPTDAELLSAVGLTGSPQ